MTDKFHDPFESADGFDSFDDTHDSGFGSEDPEDQFQGHAEADHDEFDAPVADVPAAQSKATKESKPAKVKKVSSGEPKAFIKTPMGMAGIAFAVVAVSFIGYKGFSSAFSSPSPVQAQVAQSQLPQAIEPVIGNAAGLVQTQASPEVVKAAAEPVQIKALPAVEQATPVRSGVAEEVQELKASIIELQSQTSGIQEILKGVNQSLARQEAAQNALMSSINEIKSEMVKQAQAPVPAPVAVAPAVPAVTVTAGQPAPVRQAEASARQRISGLQVIETSQGGAMSIIKKASNGRVFTLFKGETINFNGIKDQVTSIEKDGDLVLVGDKYFIDKVLDAAKAPVKAAEAPAPVRERKAVAVREAKPVEPKNAQGYTLNAVYNGKSSFGIVNNKGEFKSYKIGDTIDGLGVVTGLNDAGELKVGSTVIKSVY